jgi:type III secretion protein T
MNPWLADPGSAVMLLAMCSLRALVAMSMLPMMATNTVPVIVRGGLVLAVMLPIVALNADKPPSIQPDAIPVLLLLVRESAVGVVIGLGYGAFVAGLQAVGEIIDHQTGLTFTQNLDPINGNNVSITSLFLQHVMFAVLLASGFLLLVVDSLYLSFEVWPIGEVMPNFSAAIPLRMIQESARLFSLALLLAGPVVLVLFVVDAGASMLNRAAPQLNVFTLTLSMKSVIGVFVLAAALPMIIERSVTVMRQVALALRSLIN